MVKPCPYKEHWENSCTAPITELVGLRDTHHMAVCSLISLLFLLVYIDVENSYSCILSLWIIDGIFANYLIWGAPLHQCHMQYPLTSVPSTSVPYPTFQIDKNYMQWWEITKQEKEFITPAFITSFRNRKQPFKYMSSFPSLQYRANNIWVHGCTM